jgi:hypothetical protein
MVRGMKPFSRQALLALACASLLVTLPLLVACNPSTGAPACNALANCCTSPNVDDPSSCLETAQSGVETDAACGAQLAMYVASGQCGDAGGADAGIVDAAQQ